MLQYIPSLSNSIGFGGCTFGGGLQVFRGSVGGGSEQPC